MNIQDLVSNILLFPEDKITADLIVEQKKEFSKKNNLKSIPTNMELLSVYNNMLDEGKIKENKAIKIALRKRGIRSQSGIVPVQVLTKPFPCPGKCIFCPDDATMPKSYINTEPGAMRALLNQFDPIKQVYNRLLSLTMTGHDVDKIEIIVLGGTWDSYPDNYKKQFIKSLFDACNTFFEFKNQTKIKVNNPKFSKYTITDDLNINYPKTLQESHEINENSECRIIGLTVETRPEFVNDKNCQLWRELGITRLEIGIQNMFDDVLLANERGNTVQESRFALHKLRQYGFKFSCHFMPGLYKSTIQKDIKTMELAYSDIFIKPDEIKFYPTSVIANTKLYDLWKSGEYKPLTSEEIKYITKKVQVDIVPSYSRIKRLIRDIPETEIVAGSNITNLRQIVMNDMDLEYKKDYELRKLHYKKMYPNMKILDNLYDFFDIEKEKNEEEITYIISGEPDLFSSRNFVAIDTRSREISNRKLINGEDFLVVRKYKSSVGSEYFISFEDKLGYLYGFTRLLLPKNENTVQYTGLGKNTALIRELHVYGQVAKINEKLKNAFQHTGFGTRLMEIAEKLSLSKGYTKISVISGIGVRGYYKKIGYHLEGTYMLKYLSPVNN
ncbi:elongator complex protein 3 [Candidatus Vampirococcus lugosii]|uniref:tRNA carboxymethyluridine synthase n=1 Tax=Candidatus Vampirococcus lugosii TaxID=2789015 RepID=A0ABS5QJQ5_9BACT|nr:Histone acetyltransferase, component of the RNA polymerase elongator complex [Candidatus Vampirococcus lugosii]